MIISIAGPDTYRSREKLKSIRNLGFQKQAKEEIFDFNEIELPETEDSMLSKLKQSFNTSSLFLEKRLVIVRDIINLPKVFHTKVKNTLNQIKDNPETIILFYNTNNIPKTHPLTKVLDNLKAKHTQYEYLVESQAINYIQQMTLEQSIDITRDGIMYLVEYQKQEHKHIQEKEKNKSKKAPFRIDFYRIDSIFNQLYNYYGRDKRIDANAIQAIMPQETIYSIFSLADYIYQKNYGQYMALLLNLKKLDIEGVGLYSLLISQIKTAFTIKLAQEKGESYNHYAKGHPYVLQKTAQNIRNWQSQDLKKIYLNLIEGDFAIKFEGQDPYAILRELGLRLV